MTNKEKIRETLVAYKVSAMRAGDAQAKAMATEALALLSAEERPSVPMAMRDELGVWMQGGSAKANEILTHHGFSVKEE